ncbi:hypothetical protein [Parasedimentitalea maritima]|uniref:Uncharacterized protein n=1 Tax=Parasedimentitalea maritima TaxID=2578117 RepID=A0A6A4RKB2_9RHOB|nr:hypothetical protein [Zongyanglinia marina]KAE9632405.1 hypothetical protein GP644_01105 [Zongyanglinia marina]
MSWYGLEIPAEFVAVIITAIVVGVFIREILQPINARAYLRRLFRCFWRQDTYIQIGVFGSLTIGALVIFVSGFDHCIPTVDSGPEVCRNKLIALLESSPNEFGDALAGVAGTLAFFWIIITVMLQGKELSAQRSELRSTRKELKLSREAQQKQVTALEAQADVFKLEQIERNELRAELLFTEKMRSLITEIGESSSKGLNWAFSNNEIFDDHSSYGEIHSLSLARYIDEREVIDEAILKFRKGLLGMHENLWDYVHQSVDYRLPEKTDYLTQIIEKIERIVAMQGDLSPSQQERLSRMRLREIATALLNLEQTAEFWEENTK